MTSSSPPRSSSLSSSSGFMSHQFCDDKLGLLDRRGIFHLPVSSAISFASSQDEYTVRLNTNDQMFN
ncbi:hypothetical protein F2P81_017490 [Scophthalmus maximus]|uniref:Uncharacterized protein n=1 Tax=Scophthalmus maximus TaxID=52904 RepID=A0A6A4SDW4_SCOMX|nr:hypothetical protein F2P81_017490 [Scophthalmus maximus]